MDHSKFYDRNGRVHGKAPRWARVRSNMASAFPTYYSQTPDIFAREVGDAIEQLNQLKNARDGPAYLGSDPSGPDYRSVTEAELPDEKQTLEQVVSESVQLFDGMQNNSHPFVQPNVLPPANKAAIIAAMMTNVFGPNIIEGEYSWNVEKAEMESAAMLAKLIGWNPLVAGGLYTYGGSGCYLYGMKYALTQVDKHSRCHGIRFDGKVLVSQQGHYAKMNATDWTGLGMNNIVDVETDDRTNEMDLDDLEEKMKYYHQKKIPIISIICTMGTTDSFAVDDVRRVRELIDEYPNRKPYGPTFLYCDAVIGWSFLTFNNYNFKLNPMKFSNSVKQKISDNYEAMKNIKYADAVGIDFHKTGWAPYNCSMFMMKNLNHFRELMTRPGSAYLQERTAYNPGLYTLEVSRSGSYAMAGWATLKYFGHEGFQAILGGILEIQDYLRSRLEKEKNLVCANEEDNGFVTLIRVYPKGVNAESQYRKELAYKSEQDSLVEVNELQEKTANVLWDWFRSGKKIDGKYGPYTSFTTGFRTTNYNDDLGDPKGVVYALKSFPMNVNITHETMDTLIDMIQAAAKIAQGSFTRPEQEELVGRPYSKPTPPVTCGDAEEGGRSQVRDLMSGVVGGRNRKVGRGIPKH